MTNGTINFLGIKIAAKNKQALTIAPTSHCGWPKEKGIKKDKIDKPIKTEIETDVDRFTGKSIDRVF